MWAFPLQAYLLPFIFSFLCFRRNPNTEEALSKFPYNIKTSFDFQNMGYEKGETGKKTLFSGPALVL